jgi:Flp pilus assembly protein TadD
MRTRSPKPIVPRAAAFALALILIGFGAPARSVPARADGSDEGNAKEQIGFGIEVARRGLWEEARFRFEQAAKTRPDSAAALNNLAVALEQQGEFEKAKAAYERALQIDAKNISIQQNYDLFREADEKRNKKKVDPKAAPAKPGSSPGPAATASPTPVPTPGNAGCEKTEGDLR